MGMTRGTDTTRLADAGEERIIECPVCSNGDALWNTTNPGRAAVRVGIGVPDRRPLSA
jgi:hypothetical protein